MSHIMKDSEITTDSGKREKTKKENRTAILYAAVIVFSEIGYEASTIRDIVRESELAIGTFYNYFKDKESLIKEILDQETIEIRCRLKKARAEASNSRELIYNAYFSYLDVLSRNPLLLKMIARNASIVRSLIFQSEGLKGITGELKDDLQTAVENKMLPEININFTAWAMIGAGLEFLTRMAENPDLKPNDMAAFLTDLFLTGLE